MNTVSWVLQVLLALAFLFHFVLYAISPEALVRSMREQGQWPPAIPIRLRRFIGIAELVGAIGLIVPALVHMVTWLVPLAALGLGFVAISACIYHLRRGDPPFPAVLAMFAIVVAYLRWQVVPIGS